MYNKFVLFITPLVLPFHRSPDPQFKAFALRPSKPTCKAILSEYFIETVVGIIIGNATTGEGIAIDMVPLNITAAALFFGNAIYSFEGIGMVGTLFL